MNVSSQKYMPRPVHALLATIMALVAGAAALYLSTWLSVPFINAGDRVLGRVPYAFRVLEFAAFVVAIGIVACPLALVARAHAILYGLLAGIAASALMALMYHGDILSRQYSSFFLFETVGLLLVFPVLSMLWARLLR